MNIAHELRGPGHWASYLKLRPEYRLAMEETLGMHIPVENVPSLCGDLRVNSELCVNAYVAMKKGNKEAEELI